MTGYARDSSFVPRGVNCPSCGGIFSRVIWSTVRRIWPDVALTARYHRLECPCGHRYSTYEVPRDMIKGSEDPLWTPHKR